jgi:hypothetical protein
MLIKFGFKLNLQNKLGGIRTPIGNTKLILTG